MWRRVAVGEHSPTCRSNLAPLSSGSWRQSLHNNHNPHIWNPSICIFISCLLFCCVFIFSPVPCFKTPQSVASLTIRNQISQLYKTTNILEFNILSSVHLDIKKVKWPRYRPDVAQRVCTGIALLFHNRGTRRGWVVSSTPRPHFTPGKDPVSILQEAGWSPGPVWTGGKSRPHRDSIPERPARTEWSRGFQEVKVPRLYENGTV